MDVVFAVLPFADVNRPSIGVSLLQSAARQAGFSSTIEYFNLDFAETLGLEAYARLAFLLPPDLMAGEWFFADLAFGAAVPAEGDFVDKVLAKCAPDSWLQQIVDARRHREAFIADCVRRILAHRPRVVAFTSTFHQTCTCLAVAKRLKETPDPPAIVFGGANCEGEMGLTMIRAFAWIDYVSVGEADVSFPEFLRRLLREARDEPPPGILARGATALTRPTPVEDLDALPLPDYADYFARIEKSPVRGDLQPCALIETSRGCWWGAKHHCTFCGLNGATMAFRSKNPDRAFAELAFLSRTYGIKRIDGVDNILDVRYIQGLFPRLAASGLDLSLFYEVKSNLRFDQLASLRAGGMRAIQPGIESFSKDVLNLMKKGCSGAQNIQLLRWSQELGIGVVWNLLAGFPGESADEYRRQAELLPLLMHLAPPSTCTKIRLDRFSPLFVRSQELGLTRVRPAPGYYYAFPLGRAELAKLAYFFDFDYGDGRDPFKYIDSLQVEVQRWQAAATAATPPRLDADCAADTIAITDTREVAVCQHHQLDGLAAQIYMLCDSSQTPAGLKARLSERHAGEIDREVARLLAAKLMVEIDGQLLSLAVIRRRAAWAQAGHRHAA
jgi:ribosomal peptide maturation radical SAM protein 1